MVRNFITLTVSYPDGSANGMMTTVFLAAPHDDGATAKKRILVEKAFFPLVVPFHASPSGESRIDESERGNYDGLARHEA